MFAKNLEGLSLRKCKIFLYNLSDLRESAILIPGMATWEPMGKDLMRPTKMLPVRGSLREFQELDSSPQDLESQPRPHQVFSRCSKETRTKKVAGLICLAWICAGTVFVEYEMLVLSGAAFVVSAAACAVPVISGALYRAPEGDERADGLHIRERNRRRPFLLARSAGLQEIRTDALALGEANEPALLAARSAAPDQTHMRHSSVPPQRT